MNIWIKIFPVIFVLIILSSSLTYSLGLTFYYDKPEKLTLTNSEIIQSLISRMADKVILESKLNPEDSIELRISKYSDDSWIAKQAIISQLKILGYNAIYINDASALSRYLIEVENTNYQVKYDSMYTDGFFGKKKVKRNITAEVAIQTKSETGKILFNNILKETSSDIVFVDDIPSLELINTKSTHGDIPEDSLLSHIVEPFIIIGATGVAVFLFFHIRTQ